jgi:catalase
MLVLGAGAALLSKAGIPVLLPGGKPDPGIVTLKAPDRAPPTEAFIAAIARHRHFERHMDPPPV